MVSTELIEKFNLMRNDYIEAGEILNLVNTQLQHVEQNQIEMKAFLKDTYKSLELIKEKFGVGWGF